jgi:hypothetical protein
MRVVLFFMCTMLICCSNSKFDLNSKVHNSYRLETLQDTMQLIGEIHSIESCFDGDIHIRMKISELHLLHKRNFTKQDSCMVLEIVCVESAPIPACVSYKNQIQIPKVGDSIAVTGRFVFDKIHRWNELHPVYEIEFLK